MARVAISGLCHGLCIRWRLDGGSVLEEGDLSDGTMGHRKSDGGLCSALGDGYFVE